MGAFQRIEPWSMSTDSNWHAIHEGITTVALIPHGGKPGDAYPLAVARMAQAAPDLLDLVKRMAAYISDRVDVVDGPDGEQHPNEWASMQVEFGDEIYRLTKAEGDA